jgi:hypothetical protein
LNDADLARRMGEDARRRIRAHFSLDRHISVLQRVLDDSRSSH